MCTPRTELNMFTRMRFVPDNFSWFAFRSFINQTAGKGTFDLWNSETAFGVITPPKKRKKNCHLFRSWLCFEVKHLHWRNSLGSHRSDGHNANCIALQSLCLAEKTPNFPSNTRQPKKTSKQTIAFLFEDLHFDVVPQDCCSMFQQMKHSSGAVNLRNVWMIMVARVLQNSSDVLWWTNRAQYSTSTSTSHKLAASKNAPKHKQINHDLAPEKRTDLPRAKYVVADTVIFFLPHLVDDLYLYSFEKLHLIWTHLFDDAVFFVWNFHTQQRTHTALDLHELTYYCRNVNLSSPFAAMRFGEIKWFPATWIFPQ